MPTTTLLTAAAAFSALALFPTQQPQPPDFRPLEFVVGSCWVGTFPDGKATDEHCFEWVYDRKFIRDRHVVRNGEAPYAGEALYGWDPKAKRLAFWYWIWGIPGAFIAVPLLATLRICCDHIEALAPVGEFLGEKTEATGTSG